MKRTREHYILFLIRSFKIVNNVYNVLYHECAGSKILSNPDYYC